LETLQYLMTMQEIGNKTSSMTSNRLLIRVGQNTLSFATSDDEKAKQNITYEPYKIKGGISMSVNLRDAFNESPLLQRKYKKTTIMVDAHTLIIPVEEYSQKEEGTLFRHVYTEFNDSNIHHQIINELNSVIVFAINKDLEMVIRDHYNDINIIPLIVPVWRYIYSCNFIISKLSLFCYFHNDKIDIFCYDKNKFKFANSYESIIYHDSLFYILSVCKQLGFNANEDVLYIMGTIEEKDKLIESLKKYLHKVYFTNLFERDHYTSITKTNNMPIDMMIQLIY
jgi:hypothetical protein